MTKKDIYRLIIEEKVLIVGLLENLVVMTGDDRHVGKVLPSHVDPSGRDMAMGPQLGGPHHGFPADEESSGAFVPNVFIARIGSSMRSAQPAICQGFPSNKFKWT